MIMDNSFSAVISNLISLSELHDYWLHEIISQAGQLLGVNDWMLSSSIALRLIQPESYKEKKIKTIGVLPPPFWRRAIQKRPLKIFIPPLRGKSIFPGNILYFVLSHSTQYMVRKYPCLHYTFCRFISYFTPCQIEQMRLKVLRGSRVLTAFWAIIETH